MRCVHGKCDSQRATLYKMKINASSVAAGSAAAVIRLQERGRSPGGLVFYFLNKISSLERSSRIVCGKVNATLVSLFLLVSFEMKAKEQAAPESLMRSEKKSGLPSAPSHPHSRCYCYWPELQSDQGHSADLKCSQSCFQPEHHLIRKYFFSLLSYVHFPQNVFDIFHVVVIVIFACNGWVTVAQLW